MNKARLFIPDPHVHSSYYILYSLRKYCAKIIVGIPRVHSFSALTAFSAYSKYVNRVYFTNNYISVFRDSNAEVERNYIEEVLCICRKEKISIIYPSWDPAVFIFSKYKHKFKEEGIDIPVPDYPVLVRVMNKYELMKNAGASGINCPKTILLNSLSNIDEEIERFSFPVILKPNYGYASLGVKRVNNKDEFILHLGILQKKYKDILIQEFIPLHGFFVACIIMDKYKEYRKELCTCWIGKRQGLRVFQHLAASQRVASVPGNSDSFAKLFKEIGYLGYAFMQFIVDSRDNSLKLIEVNPRFGNCSWMSLELGINYPLLNLNINLGKDIEIHRTHIPEDTIFLAPERDFIILMIYIWCTIKKRIKSLFIKNTGGQTQSVPTLIKLISTYKKDYFFANKRFELITKNFFSDPLVSISSWFSIFCQVIKDEYPRNFQE